MESKLLLEPGVLDLQDAMFGIVGELRSSFRRLAHFAVIDFET